MGYSRTDKLKGILKLLTSWGGGGGLQCKCIPRFSQTIRKCQHWHFRLYSEKTKKKSSNKMIPLVEIEPGPLWFQVQHAPLYTNLTFAYKTETLDSLFSHALLIPLKSIKVQISSGAWILASHLCWKTHVGKATGCFAGIIHWQRCRTRGESQGMYITYAYAKWE